MGGTTDKFTHIINTAISFIFIKHPTRTSLGIVVGIILHTFTKIFSPVLGQLSIINLSMINPWEIMVVGVFLLHIKTIYELLRNKTSLSENEEKAFDLIRIAKQEGKITDLEAKNLYLNLCERVLANVELKQGTKEGIDTSVE